MDVCSGSTNCKILKRSAVPPGFPPTADIDRIPGRTGRLFLPFDFRIERKLDGNAALSFELGVPIIKDYPVYTLKTQMRFNLAF